MGTSRGYNAPTGGGWPPLKRLVNNFTNQEGDDAPPPVPNDNQPQPPTPDNVISPQQLLTRYVQTLRSGTGGGSQGSTSSGGGGSGGSGGGGGRTPSTGMGRSATRVGRNLGGFATRVSQVGLSTTLREFDLGHLVGRPAAEVTKALVDQLAGPGSTMDENLARIALDRLREELLGDALSYEDVERTLNGVVERLQVVGLVVRFFGYYLYERFCRDFYERVVQRVGREKAQRKIASIRRTIFASLEAKVAIGGTDIDWRGLEGQQLAERILEQTLDIFTVGA
jgi:hypothetical protein